MSNLYRGVHGASQGSELSRRDEIARTKDEQISPFMQVFVLEVISDPQQITTEKIEYWRNVLDISLSPSSNFDDGDPNSYRVLPRNTIIGKRKNDGTTGVTPAMFLLPFFPSHLSLPCKPGELVWAVYENPYAGNREIAYWMCKVPQPEFIDDVNHTHVPAALLPIPGTIDKSNGSEQVHQLRNGKLEKVIDRQTKETVLQTAPRSRFINDSREDVFEKLVTETDAAKLMQYEKVPRFKKRPGDVVLEGSNNSLIVLGTDRIGPIATYVPSPPPPEGAKPDKNFAKGLTPVLEDVYKDEAGSIDMVVGRGYSEETGGDSIESKSILGNQPIKEELDKYNPPENEGDPDFKNDRSRILISQRTSVDHNFKLTDYMIDATRRGPTGALLDSENGDAAIMIKSDKIRLVARSDISLIVTNYKVDEEAPVNNEYKTESEDKKEWASIIIRSNGDIIFTPSEKGLIKLGGDDADKAILCTDNLTRKPTVKNGKVIFKPGITTTGIDFVGTGAANQGTFAKKILVK